VRNLTKEERMAKRNKGEKTVAMHFMEKLLKETEEEKKHG